MPDETLQAWARSDTGADERAIALDILREREKARGVEAKIPLPGDEASSGGTGPLLGVLGLVTLVIGGWYLFVAPGPEGGETITLHRLAIGAALLIVGAVWIAAQWRPR